MKFQKPRRFYSHSEEHKKRSRRKCVVRFLILAYAAYWLLDWFIIETAVIGSKTMSPTFDIGDRIVVAKIHLGIRIPFSDARIGGFYTVERGDVVLVRPSVEPNRGIFELFWKNAAKLVTMGFYDPLENRLVKRVLAVPGDTIKIEDFEVWVRTSGSSTFVHESVLIPGITPEYDSLEGWGDSMPLSSSMSEITLKPGEYFVIGDRRDLFDDSRIWGPLDEGKIEGVATLRYFPFRSYGSVH